MKGIAEAIRRRVYFGVLVFGALICLMNARAQAQPIDAEADYAVVKAILETPDKDLDLAGAKVSIDALVDPSIDRQATLKQLDDIAMAVRRQIPFGSPSRVVLDKLKTYLYQPGPWNDNAPFQYNFDDPLGHDLLTKLLANYLKTKKGNCISMPMLFVVLGQKLGLDVTLTIAPSHMLVKYRENEQGNWLNVETTSGANFARDAWIRQQNPVVTDLALQTGIYLRPMSKKEAVVEMVGTLMELYAMNGFHQARIRLARLSLQYAPKYVHGMLHLAHAYGMLAENAQLDYGNPNPISQEQRFRFMQLAATSNEWGARAEAMGWVRPSAATAAAYMKRIEEAKKGSQGVPQ